MHASTAPVWQTKPRHSTKQAENGRLNYTSRISKWTCAHQTWQDSSFDLQDYPGQGSAYVGILDAFLDSKGLCTADEWRGWCSEVVPLLIADRFCHTSSGGLNAKVKIANYSGKSLDGRRLEWTLSNKSGRMPIPAGEGLIDVGDIDIDLADIHAPHS